MTLAIVFPGQGSQSPGMQADLAERFEVVRDTWSEANDVLGFDLWELVCAGPAEKLAETTVTQPAMLAETLAATDFTTPDVSVISAATAEPYVDGDDIRTKLAAQVYSPVLWVRTVEAMIAAGADKIVECGPGKVLAGLIRRIDKSVQVGMIHDNAGLDKALEI